ncbi:peptidoglycan DD-metalloendopeptidase family protein [Lysinibacillus sp. NPDC097231]|uniref:peptidoglycan DD-metalloendopeptidase family protein n=1 Tax=Lysinibacillus sp. NPDC097231 TaxID=3364142 RepID=UPI0038050D75
MSTGGGQTKSTELLVALGINDQISKKNINTYIKNLKNIPNLTVNLEVKGQNTQIFNEYAKQIKALEQQLEAFNLKLKNVGSGASPSLSFFDDFKQQVTSSVKSVDTLNKAFGDIKINVSSFYKQLAKVPTGDLQSLKKIVSQLKSEMESVATNQFKFVGIQETQQNLQVLETNLSNIYELQRAYADTTTFEQLTSQIAELNTQITNIQLGEGLNIAGISEIPGQLEKINQGIAEFGKNTTVAAQNSKSFASSIMDGIGLASTFKTLGEDITGLTFSPRNLLKFNAIATVGDFVINKIIESHEKKKQKIEELKAKDQEILDSYTSNASEIDSQLERYSQLENAMALGNTDPTIIAEYRDISNQLGEILPNIVDREDELGNKIVVSAEALKVKVGLLKEQQAIEAQIAERAAQEERNGNIETRKSTISDLQKDQKSLVIDAADKLNYFSDSAPSIEYTLRFSDEKGEPLLKTVADFEKKLEELDKLQSNAVKSGNSGLVDFYQKMSISVKHYMDEISANEEQLTQNISAQKLDYISNIAHVISENDKLSDSLKNNAEGFAAHLIEATDIGELDNLQESLTSLFSNKNADTVINDIIGSFQNMENATSETFDSMANKAKDKMGDISGDLLKLGLSEKEVNSIMAALKQRYEDTTQKQKELSHEMKVNNLTFAEAKEKVEGTKNEVEKLTTIYEKLAGVSQKKVNDTSDLLYQYEMLTNKLQGYNEEEIRNLSQKGNLTAEEQRLVNILNSRDLVMKSLNKLYPSLLDQDGKLMSLDAEKIKVIEAENKANQALLKAYELAAAGKMTAEGKATMVHLEETNKRINNINAEIIALNKLQNEYNTTINKMSANDKYDVYNDMDLLRKEKASMQAYDKTTLKLAELATLSGAQSDYADSLMGIVNSIGKSDKAQKESNKTTKESIYITDTYKQKLEELNLEIEKQQKIQSRFPKHSAEYKKAIEEQIKLEKQKLAVQEDQVKALKAQIASGKIQQTGNVSSNSSSSTSTTSNGKINGFGGKTNSGYGNRILNGEPEFHRGIDLDGSLGARLDAPVSGKVIKAGDALANGKNGTYGNLVIIQDDSGVQHLMAHMDNVVAKIGDYVQVGTQIGTIGSTGNSSGPHVHYEQSLNGKLIDPTSYVNQIRSGKVSVSTTSGGVSTVDTSQQAHDQAKSDSISAEKDAMATREKIEKLNEESINADIARYTNLIAGIDRSIKKSNILSSQQLEHSQEYRDELEKETKHLKYKQDLLHKEADFIREQLKRTDISPDYKDELTTQLSELSLTWWDVAESIEGVDEKIENSKIAEFDKKIEKLNDSISLSTTLMNMHVKGTKEYNDEQKNIISKLYEKQKAYEAEAEALRKSIQLDKLSIKEIERKTERLKELSSTWLETQSEIIRINSDIADELISTMKDAYGQQRDYELALKDEQIKKLEELYENTIKAYDLDAKAYEESIKDQMDVLDKAHKDKLKKLDEESKAFEDAIKRQLDLMRKQREEESFDKDIGKLQKEEATIVAKINELSMDDSREARLQRKKLEEELANISEQIAEKQNDRQYELREQNLQDELDTYISQHDAKKELEDNNYNTAKEALDNQLELYNKDLEAKKKLEEDKYKATKEQLDKERKEIVNHYDELINNEKYYADLRSQIINGNVDAMSEKLSTFLGDFQNMNKDLIEDLGLSWQELQNKIYQITQLQGSLGNVSIPNQNFDLNSGSIISSSNTNNSSSNSSTPTNTARDNAWQQYLANKKSWETASATEKARLNAENEKLRKQYGFQDGSYDALKNLKKYHSGGIVGGKGNQLTELTNKLFNTKPSEETVLALKRELFVPENNISNMFTNIRAAIPDFKVQRPQGGTIRIDNLLSIENVSQNANLDIDRLLDQGMNRLIDKMKPYGFKL